MAAPSSLFALGRERVNPLARTLIVALLTFVSGLLGFLLQWLLPVQDVAGAKGIICSIIVFVALLLAFVLGLLIWTTYGAFITQNAESQSLGPLILKLDFALEQYGPEADRGRDLLRAAVVRARDRFWGGRAVGVTPYAQLRADLHDMMGFFASLEPATDQQKQLITTAMPNFVQVVETTLLMTRRLANPVPKLLLFVVDRMGGPVVHELRTVGRLQRAQRRHRGAWLDRGRERDLHHSRVHPTLFGAVSHFAGRRRQSDRRAWPLKARPGSPTTLFQASKDWPREGRKRMYPALRARTHPDQPAVIMAGSGETITYGGAGGTQQSARASFARRRA